MRRSKGFPTAKQLWIWIRTHHVFWVRGRYYRREAVKNTHANCLSAAQKAEIRDYWKGILPRKYQRSALLFTNRYYEATGRYAPNYLPDDFCSCELDCKLNDWESADILDNKCLYSQLFSGIRQPLTVCCRENGFWFADGKSLTWPEEVLERLADQSEVVMKIARDSMGGKGVRFWHPATDREEIIAFVAGTDEDIVVQEPVEQHPVLAQFAPHSVNTLRFVSLLLKDEVRILSVILRTGAGESRVDNTHSGGVYIGVDARGRLKRDGFDLNGKSNEKHPYSQIAFAGIEIPGFAKACESVKMLQKQIPHCRFCAWDVAIDRDGEPVLIETNMQEMHCTVLQYPNGPLLGDDSREIIREVLQKGTE